MRFLAPTAVVAIIVGSQPDLVYAGMPSALPEDFELVLRLNEPAHERFQVISFFLVGILAAALVVQWAWNYLRGDFSRLPRLSYPRALSAVLLWGLLFIVVLTMISGARELMTPGAWRKSGLTYTLDNQSGEYEASPAVSPGEGAP